MIDHNNRNIDYLRISVGTDNEMEQLVTTLSQLLKEK